MKRLEIPAAFRSIPLAALLSISSYAVDSAAQIYPPESYITQEQRLPQPTTAERLPTPVTFTRCPGISVIEWKPSSQFVDVTSPSKTGYDVIEKVCADVFERYASFLSSKNIPFAKTNITTSISLLPANVLSDGKDFRNLNDFKYRFNGKTDGCCQWGVFLYSISAVFVRNDPVARLNGNVIPNKYFERTLYHEFAHVFNYYWGVRDFVGSKERDEQLAEEWVRYAGYRFNIDSSAEDYTRKTGIKF